MRVWRAPWLEEREWGEMSRTDRELKGFLVGLWQIGRAHV